MMAQHRYANTAAATILADGLRSAAQERGLSLREIGRRLGYRQPVVLSHMASGRVPVPIDRATDIAQQVGISPDHFLEAVLSQHHPEVEWGLITGKPGHFLQGLEKAAGKPLVALSAGHHRILREVVKDTKPEERWLSMPEIAAVRLLRELFPRMPTSGLSEDDRDALRLAADLRATNDGAHSNHHATSKKKNES
jgi:transcriptional regulator with XRE-family HTH domain